MNGASDKEQIQSLEARINRLKYALRTMTTAGSVVPGDPYGDAYIKAGGGYAGLQAIAGTALEIDDQSVFL